MQFVVLNILCWLVFSQTLRYAQHRQARDYVVGAVNYVLAALISLGALAALALVRAMPPLYPAGALGAACGASYFGQFLLILLAYRLAGVGITTAVASMGLLVPILVSWRFWGEPMTPWRWGALALLPVAMLLVRPVRRQVSHLSWKADAVLLLAFLNAGFMSTLHKAVGIYAPAQAGGETFLFFHPQQLAYEAGLFVVAGACSVAYALARRGGCGRVELALGSVVGVSNVLGTMFSVVGLSIVAAGVFFPTLTCALVVLSVVVSRLLWNERVTRRQIAGLALAICIVVMVNL